MKNQKELPTLYQQFIHQTRYAKWIEGENRRETWAETIDRYMTHMKKHLHSLNGIDVNDPIFQTLQDAIENQDVMPSMRAMMTSGPALERDNIAGFNCSFISIDNPRAFDEMVYILMCGTGVGFSVERQEVAKLPVVPDALYETYSVINVCLLYTSPSPRD